MKVLLSILFWTLTLAPVAPARAEIVDGSPARPVIVQIEMDGAVSGAARAYASMSLESIVTVGAHPAVSYAQLEAGSRPTLPSTPALIVELVRYEPPVTERDTGTYLFRETLIRDATEARDDLGLSGRLNFSTLIQVRRGEWGAFTFPAAAAAHGDVLRIRLRID